ncbi:uncharacterized protein [Procambarus clarkii]|uniref:uncharacterized protein n=1 Tax=Procambarus clarkii TaxID=6728 RepID=UPI001E675391|nr:uncharacterized protein LOC123773080 [Procambarus clarkii]
MQDTLTSISSSQAVDRVAHLVTLAFTVNMGMLSVAMVVLVVSVGVESSPLMRQSVFSGPPMHRVDICILACDACYKGDALLMCANSCLKDEGRMNFEWSATCPFFDSSRK